MVFLPLVAAGMHHGLIALYTVQLETFGYVTLYPALAMVGAGQAERCHDEDIQNAAELYLLLRN